MMDSGCDHHHGSCGCVLSSGGVSQSLEEMEFDRGIWQAAMDGDERRVGRLLAGGTDPNALDSAGYTALAAERGHLEVCRVLVEADKRVVSLRDHRDRLALHLVPPAPPHNNTTTSTTASTSHEPRRWRNAKDGSHGVSLAQDTTAASSNSTEWQKLWKELLATAR